MVIDCKVAAVTVSVVEPAALPNDARMTVLPGDAPTANPLALLTLAAAVSAEVQIDSAVTSRDVPSAKLAVARYCWGGRRSAPMRWSA